MPIVLFKALLTPLLIAAATLVGRRWGPGVGGWLVGLPLTSAPVALFLALDHGTQFAANAASGSLVGAAAEAAFCGGYLAASTTGWQGALSAGTLAFTAASLVLLPATAIRPIPLAILVGVVLLVSLRVVPPSHVAPAAMVTPAWDLPARMVIGAALVLAITAAAPVLGPHVSGIAATFPVFAAVLAVFAHRVEGPRAARQVLRGLLAGLFAFAAFFVVLGSTIEGAGIAGAFLVSSAGALAVQGVSLRLVLGASAGPRAVGGASPRQDVPGR